MSFLDALRRPAIRMPILLVLTFVAGALLSRQCGRMARSRALATARHLRCIDLVTRAAAEAGRRPGSLAELVGTAEQPGIIEALFQREYAGLPEFANPASDAQAPAPRPQILSLQVRGPELLWEGYCYRLWPNPGNERDFAIFVWPEAPGVGRLTSAYVSSDPARLYYTYALRYAGANAGPAPADLGEPFAGRISLLEGLDPKRSPEEFMERAGKSGGRRWARMETMGAGASP